MNDNQIIDDSFSILKSALGSEPTGHDHWHGYRVRKLALHIAKEEGVSGKESLLVIQLAALLHDLIDYKLNTGWNEDKLAAWVSERTDAETSRQVMDIIKNVSFKGAGAADAMTSIEGKIVQDADRLDALGAIGIARVFATGAYLFKRPIHDPDTQPTLHKNEKSYKSRGGEGGSINHFYEKLFLLKDRMHTKAGRRIAEEREAYMKQYVERFMQEWEGKE